MVGISYQGHAAGTRLRIDTLVVTYCLRFFLSFKRALDIMDVMLERNVEPNIVTYGTAISSCARGGTYLICFQAFYSADQEEDSNVNSIPVEQLRPDVHRLEH